MTRHERALIYQDTKHMVGTHPALKSAVSSSTAQQEVISEADNIQIPPPRHATPAQLEASQKRSFQAAAGYPGQKVCVHNFTSSCNPGGGVVHGSLAQEECLCRASTLHYRLTSKQNVNRSSFMGKNFRETLAEQLKDPEFKKVWDKESTRRKKIRAQIEAGEFAVQPIQKKKEEIFYELS